MFQLEKLEYRIWIRKIRNTITEMALILKVIQIFIICRADITMQRWEEFLRRNLVKRYMNKYHKHVCITSEIQDNAYDELMNWLESKCDSFSFCLPHFGKVVVTESNADIYPEYEIGYLGQYLSTKSTYNEFLKARFKGKFRKDHADEIEKHEKAAQILKAQNPDGSLPKMKDLKLEKERLLALKAAQYDTYTYYKDYQKELRTACANVDSILGQHHIRDHIQRTEQTL